MPKNKPNVFDGQDITASEFFKTHWQRAPYLFTNTNIELNCLPSIEHLFKLADKEGVQSRIIYSTDDLRYQAIYDEPGAWQEVESHKPTLLVSDIEKWYPSALNLMSWFPFIKSWRFDDLMMSYAPKGASVGAHTDHYDVFLVQVQGTRQWSFDDLPIDDEYELVEDSELSVIADFNAKHSIELKAGDVLYLPPEIPHHGVSTSDDCVTCSIGLRSPSNSELLSSVIEQHSQELSPKSRFKDSVNQPRSDASIGQHEIDHLRTQLRSLSELSDQQLAQHFGQTVTSYRLIDDDAEICTVDEASKTSYWKKSPFAVFAYHAQSDTECLLFVNGESYSVNLSDAEAICNHDEFQIKNEAVLDELIEIQAIIPA